MIANCQIKVSFHSLVGTNFPQNLKVFSKKIFSEDMKNGSSKINVFKEIFINFINLFRLLYPIFKQLRNDLSEADESIKSLKSLQANIMTIHGTQLVSTPSDYKKQISTNYILSRTYFILSFRRH